MEEDLLKIINHYGVMTQLKYFQSEVFELNEAIIVDDWEKDILNDKEYKECKIDNIDHIAEEIADVMVMLKQFQEYYLIQNDYLAIIFKQKVKRQLERIENENN